MLNKEKTVEPTSKSGNDAKPIVVGSCDYRETKEGKRRFANKEIYEKTLAFQYEMKKHGVAWHNHFSDECTIDFCCCQGDQMKELKGDNGQVYPATQYRHYIPSFRTVVKEALNELYEQCKHGDAEHQKWLKDKFDAFAYHFED